MSQSGEREVQLGKYGVANCYWARCENLPQNSVDPYSPFLKVIKKSGIYQLQVVCFVPSNYALDAEKPLVFDNLGKDLFLFMNFGESKEGPANEFQYFLIKVNFSDAFSAKLKGKNIFVMPVHGDPEEGDMSKVIVEDEEDED